MDTMNSFMLANMLSSFGSITGYAAMILGIVFLILIHELGHWLVARSLGFKTPVFAVGFGKREWSLVLGTWWETEFRLSPILLGGYVSIPELQDESTIGEGEPDKSEPQKFFPVWKRISVAAAGVVMNFAFAIAAIAMLFYTVGSPSVEIDQTRVEALSQEITLAKDAGLEPGDIFLKIDGREIKSPADLKSGLTAAGGNPVVIEVMRNGENVVLTLTPDESGMIGVVLSVDSRQVFTRMSPWQASSKAVATTVDSTVGMVKGIGMMVGLVEVPAGLPDGAADVHGVVGIVQIGAQAWDMGIFQFVWILAMISINLAVLNILPIPMLDGGHILFFSIEAVTGKPVPAGIRNRLALVFLMLLLGLMFLGLFNDITKPIQLK